MKKVLLIVASPANKKNFINTMPPMGALYLASFLESKGVNTDVIDYNVSDIDASTARNYDLIGFSVNCGNITNTLRMAKKIKEDHDKEIIVGGPQVISDPIFFLQKEYIDGAIVGEGEYALYEYITQKKLVKGIYLKTGNKEIAFGGNRPFIKDLDSLPFPALGKIDIKKYNVPLKRRKPTSTILTSRGCPFGCIFCFHSLGYQYRPRSAKNVVDEIEWQVKNFNVREICTLDDNITLDINRAKEIFKGVINKNLNVLLQLYNGIRVDRVDKELLILMKKAKLWYMNVAPESGDTETIRLIKKNFDKETIKRATKMIKDMGFFTYSNFMVGFPWETKEHIKRTIEFALELDTDMVQFARVTAFPNTELYTMSNLSYRIEDDIGLFYNDPKFNISQLNECEINELIKKAYRKYYLRPGKMISLLKNLRWADIYSLLKYSMITGSV